MNVITLGAMVGPTEDVEVIATAQVQADEEWIPKSLHVFVGRQERFDRYIVSTYDEGADWWHSGFYTESREAALSRFIYKINPDLVVFRP